jgi:hypothetical protein
MFADLEEGLEIKADRPTWEKESTGILTAIITVFFLRQSF